MTLSGRSCGRGVGWNLHGEISEKVKGLLNRRSRKSLGFATPAEVFLDNHWEKILRFSVESATQKKRVPQDTLLIEFVEVLLDCDCCTDSLEFFFNFVCFFLRHPFFKYIGGTLHGFFGFAQAKTSDGSDLFYDLYLL